MKRRQVWKHLGDFSGMGHNLTKNFVSLPLQMILKRGGVSTAGSRCLLKTGARIEVVNEADKKLNFYFYIDYESYPTGTSMADYARFHAQWRRINPTPGWQDPSERWEDNHERMREVWRTPNTNWRCQLCHFAS